MRVYRDASCLVYSAVGRRPGGLSTDLEGLSDCQWWETASSR